MVAGRDSACVCEADHRRWSWNVVTKEPHSCRPERTIAEDASAGNGASGQFSRPQWSPNGNGSTTARSSRPRPQNYDIYRAAADGSDKILGGTPIVAGSANTIPGRRFARWVAALLHAPGPHGRPEGRLHGPVVTRWLAGSADNRQRQRVRVRWSPDGTKIAFVRGAFGAGQILMVDLERVDGHRRRDRRAGSLRRQPRVDQEPVADVLQRERGGCVQFLREHSPALRGHAGPARLRFSNSFGPTSLTPPDNGVLGRNLGDLVIYTPNVNFRGSDSFTFKSDDGTSDSNIAKIQSTVAGPGGGGEEPDRLVAQLSPQRWRRGSRLPRVSATPVGTKIGVGVSAAGRVKLTFKRRGRGAREEALREAATLTGAAGDALAMCARARTRSTARRARHRRFEDG